jgi:hypothetical protein
MASRSDSRLYAAPSMGSSQLPSQSEFVVNVSEGDLEEALAAGSSEAATGPRLDEHTFLVELPSPDDPRSAWQRLVDQFGSASWVSPVVVDDGSVPHYPTGDVTVRFRAPVSDSELEAFAASNGLELNARNEFVAEQASFRPQDRRGTYLPDLVEHLERDDAVGAVWLNTKSAYKRA